MSGIQNEICQKPEMWNSIALFLSVSLPVTNKPVNFCKKKKKLTLTVNIISYQMSASVLGYLQ